MNRNTLVTILPKLNACGQAQDWIRNATFMDLKEIYKEASSEWILWLGARLETYAEVWSKVKDMCQGCETTYGYDVVFNKSVTKTELEELLAWENYPRVSDSVKYALEYVIGSMSPYKSVSFYAAQFAFMAEKLGYTDQYLELYSYDKLLKLLEDYVDKNTEVV